MYVCKDAFVYACKYVRIYVRTYECMYEYVCMYPVTRVCVCMYNMRML